MSAVIIRQRACLKQRPGIFLIDVNKDRCHYFLWLLFIWALRFLKNTAKKQNHYMTKLDVYHLSVHFPSLQVASLSQEKHLVRLREVWPGGNPCRHRAETKPRTFSLWDDSASHRITVSPFLASRECEIFLLQAREERGHKSSQLRL